MSKATQKEPHQQFVDQFKELERPRSFSSLSSKDQEKFQLAVALVQKHMPELRSLGYEGIELSAWVPGGNSFRGPNGLIFFHFPEIIIGPEGPRAGSSQRTPDSIYLASGLWCDDYLYPIESIALTIAHELLHLSLSWDFHGSSLEDQLAEIFGVDHRDPLNTTEVGDVLGINRQGVTRLIRRGELEAVKNTGIWQVERLALKRFISG